ncbi:MAG TPA: hypothetical protein VIW64_12680 [Pyrinomonadaceae bacterium]|jgi:hypothetical protein
MNELEREITERLILQPQTATDLERLLGVDDRKVFRALDDLRLSGLVVPFDGHAAGDGVCLRCGAELDDAEFGDVHEGGLCSGYVENTCIWRYCGGPISKALAA